MHDSYISFTLNSSSTCTTSLISTKMHTLLFSLHTHIHNKYVCVIIFVIRYWENSFYVSYDKT